MVPQNKPVRLDRTARSTPARTALARYRLPMGTWQLPGVSIGSWWRLMVHKILIELDHPKDMVLKFLGLDIWSSTHEKAIPN